MQEPSEDRLSVTRAVAQDRAWVSEAIRAVEADNNRSADTHMLVFPLPTSWGIDLYLKDESVHPTGSLKHRLARSLFLYALCNGWIHEGSTIIEASSGSTAVSEAYFARLLGLPFVAVVPKSTSQQKIDLIEFYGGRCHFLADPSTIYEESRRLAAESGGHFMDQFTYAERATDWRGNNNIAQSMFSQLAHEQHPVPEWVVVGAGTGGTSATVGRYVRYQRHHTKVCVVDPQNSALLHGWSSGDPDFTVEGSSRIEGIGRPRVEPSFVPGVVDEMMRVPDAASIAAARWTSTILGRKVGGSTGTAMWGALKIAADMLAAGQSGSIVTLLCDSGDRYVDTYFDDGWLSQQGLDIAPHLATLDEFTRSGTWIEPA